MKLAQGNLGKRTKALANLLMFHRTNLNASIPQHEDCVRETWLSANLRPSPDTKMEAIFPQQFLYQGNSFLGIRLVGLGIFLYFDGFSEVFPDSQEVWRVAMFLAGRMVFQKEWLLLQRVDHRRSEHHTNAAKFILRFTMA